MDALRDAKATFDAGESLWTPLLVLAIGYAVTIPIFLLMWGAALVAGELARG